jgi:hypothetical protein
LACLTSHPSAFERACPRAFTVAVRANDVALCELPHQPFAGNGAGTPKNPKVLTGVTSVVEIHHIRRELAAAVRARHASQAAKELHGFSLTGPDTLKFLFTMSGVVRDVVRALISFLHRASS